jgi:hypothetical protein
MQLIGNLFLDGYLGIIFRETGQLEQAFIRTEGSTDIQGSWCILGY